MSHYQPYPNYKNSRIDWLGKVPEAWQITRLKYVSELNPKKSSLKIEREELCTFLPMEKLKTDSVVLDETRVIEEVYEGYSYFGNGDILIAKVTPCFENKNIAIADDLVNGVGFGSTEINTIRSNEKSHNRFLYYRLQEEQFRKIAINAMTGTGGLKRVPSEIFQTFKIAIPSYDDQKRIAEQIDKETTRIDTLIAKKTRFIELLKEKRQAFITHAVTKGLDLHVKMKDSGVEWIGEVPSTWIVTKLKYIADSIIGLTYSPEDVTNDDSGTLVLRSSNIQNGQLSLGDCVKVNREIPEHLFVQNGDILVCSRNGSRDLIGKNIQLDHRTKGASFGAFMTIIRSDLNDFLYYIFNSTMFEAQADLFMTSTVNQLTISMLDNMKIAIPSASEISEIVSHLKMHTTRIDTLIEKTQRSIELLKERRSAFITAAVTGQIDLREEKQ